VTRRYMIAMACHGSGLSQHMARIIWGSSDSVNARLRIAMVRRRLMGKCILSNADTFAMIPKDSTSAIASRLSSVDAKARFGERVLGRLSHLGAIDPI
jgi:hypothetical protein